MLFALAGCLLAVAAMWPRVPLGVAVAACTTAFCAGFVAITAAVDDLYAAACRRSAAEDSRAWPYYSAAMVADTMDALEAWARAEADAQAAADAARAAEEAAIAEDIVGAFACGWSACEAAHTGVWTLPVDGMADGPGEPA